MSTKRTTISISDELYTAAKAVMEKRLFDDFSGFVHTLIREEWERRFPGGQIPNSPPPKAADPIERSVSDIARKFESKKRRPKNE